MAGSNPFTVMTNIFVTEFSELFSKNSNVDDLTITYIARIYHFIPLVASDFSPVSLPSKTF